VRNPKNSLNRTVYTRLSGRSTDRLLRCERLEDRQLLAAVVVTTSPLSGSPSVPVDTNIEATFDTTILPAAVTDQSVVVHGRQSGRLLSSIGDITSLAGVGPLVALNPAEGFHPGEFVQVTATADLLDNLSVAVTPHVWDFRTATAGGSGTFRDSGQQFGSATGWHVALGDVDSDGDLDAIVTNLQVVGHPLQVSRLWLNQSGQQGGIAGQFVDSGQSLDNTRPHDLALGDLDGDGDLDIFFGNSTGVANTVWLNQGGQQGGAEGVFANSGQLLGNSHTRGVALGDLDGDGDLDAFVANRNAQANRVWINQGGVQGGTGGQFVDSDQLLGSSTSYDVELGDLDGDGDLDAFVANQEFVTATTREPNIVWVNDGSGTFSDNGQLLGDSLSRAVSLGDLDHDGDLDAFVANRFANRIWLNQGGAQSGAAGQFVDSGQALGNLNSHHATIGDLDGDGDLDAFVANFGNGAANKVWTNQGGRQGGTAGQYSDSGQSLGSSDSRGVALGDLDNDGDLDAFVVNRSTGQTDRVWLNQDRSADFDLDDDVDGADFLAWQRGFGTPMPNVSRMDGDADFDTDVDAIDLSIWEDQYSSGTGPLVGELSAVGFDTTVIGLLASTSPDAALIDAAMALDWLGVVDNDAEAMVVVAAKLQAVEADSVLGHHDLGPATVDGESNTSVASSSETENHDLLWFADELLGRVFG